MGNSVSSHSEGPLPSRGASPAVGNAGGQHMGPAPASASSWKSVLGQVTRHLQASSGRQWAISPTSQGC